MNKVVIVTGGAKGIGKGTVPVMFGREKMSSRLAEVNGSGLIDTVR